MFDAFFREKIAGDSFNEGEVTKAVAKKLDCYIQPDAAPSVSLYMDHLTKKPSVVYIVRRTNAFEVLTHLCHGNSISVGHNRDDLNKDDKPGT